KSAGEIIGEIHRNSWNDNLLLKQFDSTDLFVQLRIDPYLHTTGNKYPEFRDLFYNEGISLTRNRRCLVHGDYSPKNLMVNGGRMVMIDSEVAWYGDPTFDVAFLLNHLFLKSIYNHNLASNYIELAYAFVGSYTETLGESRVSEILPRLGRLLLMLMIARVDGKSPVEYLKREDKKEAIRQFVLHNLMEDFSQDPITKISNKWLNFISEKNWDEKA
ncbi:MAG: phosphotransferase, partial [Nitrososphaerota archaeon]